MTVMVSIGRQWVQERRSRTTTLWWWRPGSWRTRHTV